MPDAPVSEKARDVLKRDLWWAAHDRMVRANYYRAAIAPTINRNHVDGPMFTSLDGRPIWLSPLERLLTKIGIWDAWDIEARRFPLQSRAILDGEAG